MYYSRITKWGERKKYIMKILVTNSRWAGSAVEMTLFELDALAAEYNKERIGKGEFEELGPVTVRVDLRNNVVIDDKGEIIGVVKIWATTRG